MLTAEARVETARPSRYLMQLCKHFDNKGRIEDATISVSGGNPGCGDVVTMYVTIEDGKATHVSFEGQGCTISQAGASMVAEKYEGQPLETIEHASTDDMIDEMGREVVISRVRCAAVGIGTLKGAIQQYRKEKILKEIEASSRPIS